MFTIFCDTLAGVEAEATTDFDLDATNAHFVAARQSFSVQDEQLECDINRFALRTLLLAIPESDYSRSIHFPWGRNTVMEFIEGAIAHEREHLQDVIALRQKS
ncbi:MAG: hypothetical protein IPK19_13165 [Chloroflexi bacterium]|nr:hypothetical protein [Chloroflexota bacterium]